MHRDIFLYGFGPESGRAQSKAQFLDFSYRLMPVFEKYKVDAVTDGAFAYISPPCAAAELCACTAGKRYYLYSDRCGRQCALS